MKIRSLPCVLLAGLAIAGTLLASPAPDEPGDKAAMLYQQGLKASHERRWEEAKELLSRSFALEQTTTTAYCLSVVAANLLDFQSALDYAERVLKANPPFEEPFRTDAWRIYNWAATALLAPPRYRARFVMDEDEHSVKDTMLLLKLKEDAERAEQERAALRSRVNPFLDLESIDTRIKLMGSCEPDGTPEQMNKCLAQVFGTEPSPLQTPSATLPAPDADEG